MGKYDPLRDYLASRPEDVHEFSMSFEEIEKLVGKLPRSAYVHRAWWTNASDARVEARAWRSAGWAVDSVNRSAMQVSFTRSSTNTAPSIAQEAPPAQSAATGDEATPRAEDKIYNYSSSPSGKSSEEGEQSVSTLSKRALISDILVAAIAAAAAGVSQLVGLTHLPWLALVSLTAAIAAVAFTMTQAVVSRSSAENARLWWSVSTLLVLILTAGAFAYHKLLDPATRTPRTYQFIANGDDTAVIPLFGEAGGSPAVLETGAAGQNGLIGGITYNFDCWAIGLDRAEWLRYERFGQTWWAPRKYLHPPFGEPEPQVPHC